MDWQGVWNDLVLLFGGQVWLLMITIILSLTVLADIIQRKVLSNLHKQFLKREKVWAESFVDAVKPPFSFFIWVTGTTLALNTLILKVGLYTDIVEYTDAFKSTVLTLAVGWFVIRLVARLEVHLKNYARENDRLDEVTVEALAKIIKLFAFVITGLIFLNAFGVSLTGLMAFGGLGGIAVGFAAKDLLGNVLGGLMLYLDKPFTVGDWIRSPDKSIEGTVEHIGWRMTTVRTFDKRPLYIPNGVFATIAIENPSRMTNRRIKETVGIRYSDVTKLHLITDEVKAMLQMHEDIDQEQVIIVSFESFSSSSVDFFVYTLTKTTQWIEYHRVKQDVMLKVSEIISKHGAEIAFPTRTLHLELEAEHKALLQK